MVHIKRTIGCSIMTSCILPAVVQWANDSVVITEHYANLNR